MRAGGGLDIDCEARVRRAAAWVAVAHCGVLWGQAANAAVQCLPSERANALSIQMSATWPPGVAFTGRWTPV